MRPDTDLDTRPDARSARHLFLALGLAVLASAATVQPATAQQTAPPGGDFQKVSSLVELPDFIPGLGILYVDPATLPAGPFLAYDRDGRLVSTVYMIPLDDLNEREAFENLDAAEQKVDHVDLLFNAGHPGVAEPHYHVILWHVSPSRAASLQADEE